MDRGRLINGGRVPIIKTPNHEMQPGHDQWVAGISYPISFATFRGAGWRGNQWDSLTINVRHEGNGLYYYQWLRLLLLTYGFIDPDGLARRIATLIEVNMNYHLALQRAYLVTPTGNRSNWDNAANRPNINLPNRPIHFRMRYAYVVSEARIEYDLVHLFIGNLPIGGDSPFGRATRMTSRAVRGF